MAVATQSIDTVNNINYGTNTRVGRQLKLQLKAAKIKHDPCIMISVFNNGPTFWTTFLCLKHGFEQIPKMVSQGNYLRNR